MPHVVAEVRSSYAPHKMSKENLRNSYEMKKQWSSIHFYSKSVFANGYYQAPSMVEANQKYPDQDHQILYLPLHSGGIGIRIILLWTALCTPWCHRWEHGLSWPGGQGIMTLLIRWIVTIVQGCCRFRTRRPTRVGQVGLACRVSKPRCCWYE